MKRNFFYRFLQAVFLFSTLSTIYSTQAAEHLYLPSPGGTTSSFSISATPIIPRQSRRARQSEPKNPYPQNSFQAKLYSTINDLRKDLEFFCDTRARQNIIYSLNNIIITTDALLREENGSLERLQTLSRQLTDDIAVYKDQVLLNRQEQLRALNTQLRKHPKDTSISDTIKLLQENPPSPLKGETEKILNELSQRSKQKIQDLTPPQPTIIGVPSQDTPLLPTPPPLTLTPTPALPAPPSIQLTNNQARFPSTQQSSSSSTQEYHEKTPPDSTCYNRLHRYDAQRPSIVTEQNLTYAQNQNALLEQTLQMIKDKKKLPVFMQINPDGFYIKTDKPNPEEQKYNFISRHSESLTLEHQKAGSSTPDVCELLIVEKDHIGPNGRYCKIILPLANVDQIPFLAGEIKVESGDLCDKPFRSMPIGKIPQQEATQQKEAPVTTASPKPKLIPTSLNNSTLAVQPDTTKKPSIGTIAIKNEAAPARGRSSHRGRGWNRWRRGGMKRTIDGTPKSKDDGTQQEIIGHIPTAPKDANASNASANTDQGTNNNAEQGQSQPNSQTNGAQPYNTDKDKPEEDGAKEDNGQAQENDDIAMADKEKKKAEDDGSPYKEKIDPQKANNDKQGETKNDDSSNPEPPQTFSKKVADIVIDTSYQCLKHVETAAIDYLIDCAFPPVSANHPLIAFDSQGYDVFSSLSHGDSLIKKISSNTRELASTSNTFPTEATTLHPSSSSSPSTPLAPQPMILEDLTTITTSSGESVRVDLIKQTIDSTTQALQALQQANPNNPLAQRTCRAIESINNFALLCFQDGDEVSSDILSKFGQAVFSEGQKILADGSQGSFIFHPVTTSLNLCKAVVTFAEKMNAHFENLQGCGTDAEKKALREQIKLISNHINHIRSMSWQEILEDTASLGMSFILDAVTLNILLGPATKAANLLKKLDLTKKSMTLAHRSAARAHKVAVVDAASRDVMSTLKVMTEQGPESTKAGLETISNNPEIVANSGSSVAEAMQKVANTEVGPIGAAEKASLTGRCLSKNDIQHFSKHIPAEFAQQAKRMPKEALEAILKKRTFFNPAWSEQDILQAVNEGYKILKGQGLTKVQSYNFKGEIIKIMIKPNGDLGSAWGLHKLPINYFTK